MNWSDCELVESIPGKVSGVPLLIGTRIPADAITDNYEAFLDEGMSPEAAMAETLECDPSAGMQRIKGSWLISTLIKRSPSLESVSGRKRAASPPALSQDA
jgi:hypothetical protein